MKRLPFGVRLAAGVTATLLEQARTLPGKALGFPITAASGALQYAMRVQQELTELAIKGDEALAGFRPVEQAPSWATFDEDLLDANPFDPPAENRFGDAYGSEPLESGGAEEREIAKLRADLVRYDERDPSALSAWDAVAKQLSATKTEPRTEPEEDEETGETAADQAEVEAEPEPPRAFPNYPELSLAQLRARLRRFSVADLTELLEYELATRDREDYARMLRNRIETVRSDESAQ